MTKELHDKLSVYEREMMTAYYSDYVRITYTDLIKMLTIYYGPDYKRKVSPSISSCGSCRLGAVKAIAKDYFDFKNNDNNNE